MRIIIWRSEVDIIIQLIYTAQTKIKVYRLVQMIFCQTMGFLLGLWGVQFMIKDFHSSHADFHDSEYIGVTWNTPKIHFLGKFASQCNNLFIFEILENYNTSAQSQIISTLF